MASATGQDLALFARILDESERARAKHSDSIERRSHDTRLRILVKEVGEVGLAIEDLENAQDAFDALYVAYRRGTISEEEFPARRDAAAELIQTRRRELHDELVQVASISCRWIDADSGASHG